VNSTAILIVLLLLALIVLLGNVMMAMAFLRGRRDRTKPSEADGSAAMDELHKRVQELTSKAK
jgi:flagellar basal body-associated protein FliL